MECFAPSILKNYGNTCYLNSVLQLISSTKLIEMSQGKVAGYVFVINLFDLGGYDNLIKKGYKVENLIEFPGH